MKSERIGTTNFVESDAVGKTLAEYGKLAFEYPVENGINTKNAIYVDGLLSPFGNHLYLSWIWLVRFVYCVTWNGNSYLVSDLCSRVS